MELVKKSSSSKKTKSNKAKHANDAIRYSIARKSGGKFSNLQPVFSKDEKFVFLCTDTQARVYSATTGDLVRSLTCKKSSKGPIVALFLHPTNEYRLVSVSHEGQVLVWDWTDGTLLQHATVDPATEIVAAILVGTTFIWSDGKNVHMCNDFPNLQDVHQVGRLSVCTGLDHNNENIFAFGDRSVFIFRLKEGGSTTDHEHLLMPTTQLAFAACKDYFAYAEASGAISVYPIAPFGKNKDTTPRRLHWHSSAVSTLRFALNGQYLLSGGSEGVLVLWQLSTSNRQFLPRVARTIDSIAVSSTSKYYALKIDDNTIKIIAASTLKLQADVVGPRYSGGTMSSALQGDNLYLCNATEVQVWNTTTGRTTSRIPVAAQTFAGRVSDGYPTNESTVSACAVHSEWMATIDTWTSPKEEAVDLGHIAPRDEVYLKFWRWNGKDYDLITRIDGPHEQARVSQIISSQDGAFYTTGEDATVRIWRQKPIKKDLVGGGTEVVGTTWSCRRVVRFVRKHGSCRMALSPDSSVLAVHTQDQTFLIDSTSGNLRTNLTGLSAGRVTDLGFVRNYLVILGYKRLVVWDLLVGSVSFALKIPEQTTELSLTCGDKHFALTTNEQTKRAAQNAKIFIFDPESAKPIFREKCSKTLTINWSSSLGFTHVTSELEILYLSDAALQMVPGSVISGTVDKPQAGLSTVYKIIASSASIDANQTDVDMQESVLSTQAVTKIFEDPIKTLESRFEDLASLVLGAPRDVFQE